VSPKFVKMPHYFGFMVFFSAAIAADSGQQFGTLDVYSCLQRTPSPWELQLVGRAVCLAAIAVGSRTEARDRDHYAIMRTE
jgi:hypothetical protein